VVLDPTRASLEEELEPVDDGGETSTTRPRRSLSVIRSGR
jgi:hypothetical protein